MKIYKATSRYEGFTLVEVVLVIVVMAILGYTAMARLADTHFYEKQFVYTTVHKIASDIRLARRLSVTSGHDVRVVFSRDGGSTDYNVYNIQERDGGWISYGEERSIPDEIVVSGSNNISFSSDGSASNERNFIYNMGEVTFTINVKRATGAVKMINSG